MASIIEMQSQQTDGASASSDTNSATKSLFSKLDTDGDGQITKSELEQAFAGSENSKIKEKAASLAEALMNKADADGDGKISESEMKAAQKNAQARHRQQHTQYAQMNPAIQALTAANAASTASLTTSAIGATA
jgi:Ca2+-binding EF-hand superfamily protein